MVKYKHCEKCKSIYSTEPWIGEIHMYNGICPSCSEEEQEETHTPQEFIEETMERPEISENIEKSEKIAEITQSSPLEIEKDFLKNLEQKADLFLSSGNSIDVLIKEIRDGLVDKAKERIEQNFQSFDAGKLDAQKAIDYAESILGYLSEYKEFMDNVVVKIQTKPKMKVKAALDKVLKESIGNIPKDLSKDIFLQKKTMLNTVSGKAFEWYNLYSDIKDPFKLSKKMVLHPFDEIQKKLGTLPFYTQSNYK